MPTDRSKNQPNQQTPMSHALLLRLHALPRLVVPAIAVVLALVGLMARPTFAVPALLVLFAFLCWLASLTWHQLDRRGRLLRALAIGALGGLLLGKVVALLGLV